MSVDNLLRQARAFRPRPDVFARLMELDEELVRKGWPPMTDWWKETLRAFYASKKRRLVIRAGRKGIKSSSMCRVSVAEALGGGHILRPGDLGLFPFLSENRPEAHNRIFTIKQILDAIGMKWEPMNGDVFVPERRISFGVRAGRVGAVSGPVVVGFVGDEVAKWRDEDTGANPATEVLRSLRPAMITQPSAHEFLISSPWSTMDAHYEAFEEGDTEDQMVAHAPSWVANPTITEADTRKLERDHVTWMREYAAIPMSGGTTMFFDAQAVDAAVKDYPLPRAAEAGAVITAGGDFGFQSDSSALAMVHRIGKLWRLADLIELRPEAQMPLKPSEVVREFALRMQLHGPKQLMADGHYRMSIWEHLEQHKLTYIDAPGGVDGIAKTYISLRVLLNEGQLELSGRGPEAEKLIRQLKETISRPTPGGAISIQNPRKKGGHGDLVSALVLAAWQREGYVMPAAAEDPSVQMVRRMAEAEEEEAAPRAKAPWWEDPDDPWNEAVG